MKERRSLGGRRTGWRWNRSERDIEELVLIAKDGDAEAAEWMDCRYVRGPRCAPVGGPEGEFLNGSRARTRWVMGVKVRTVY